MRGDFMLWGAGWGCRGRGFFLLGCIWLHLVAFCGWARLSGGGDFFSLVAFGCILRLGLGGFSCFWSHLVAFGRTWRVGSGASFDKLRMIGRVRDGWAGSGWLGWFGMVGLVRVVRFVIVGKGFGGWQGGRGVKYDQAATQRNAGRWRLAVGYAGVARLSGRATGDFRYWDRVVSVGFRAALYAPCR